MLEMAIVSVIFFLLIFSLLDLMRYMAIRATLVRGAQAGLTMAQQIAGFEEDVRTQPLGSTAMTNVKAARRAAIDAATTIPLSFLLDPSGVAGSFAKLTNFENHTFYNNAGGVWSVYQDPAVEMAAVLRPGDYACDVGASGAGGCAGGSPKLLCHPTLVDPGGNCPATASVPAMTILKSWNEVLQNNPLVVKMRAEITPLMSWVWAGETWLIESTEIGFREPIRDAQVLPDMNIPVRPILPPPPIPPAAPPPTLTCCCSTRDYYSGTCTDGFMTSAFCPDPC